MRQPSSTASSRGLVLVGLVLLATNLRPAAVSIGPVLAEVTDGLGMTPVGAGLLTSLPVLAFATFGAVAPWLARTLGVHRTTLVSLVAVAIGLAARVTVDHELPFLMLSLLGLAGMAAANVLLPSLVKLHFPDRVGTITALYTTAMAVGITGALTATVPVSEELGGWRVGLGVWALLALVAALPWLWLIVHDRHLEPDPHTVRVTDVMRTRLGLAMALMFGFQSMHAYIAFGWFAQLWRDAGFSPAAAGALVALLASVSIPLSLWLPRLAGRRTDHRSMLWSIIACYPVAYVGLMIAPGPAAAAVIWALLVGIGLTTFPLVLTLIGLRSRTPAGTAALSGFTQSAGYLIAAGGPFTIGLVYASTGSWTVPLGLMIVLVLPMALLVSYVGPTRYVEDQLPDPVVTS